MIEVVKREDWVDPAIPFGPNTPPFPAWPKIKLLLAHWPGTNVNITTKDQMKNLMRSIQRQDKLIEGFDFEYNWCLDPWGVFWEGRGFDYRNAANGKNNYAAIKAQYGVTATNTNFVSMSVNIICNLNQGANPAQQAAMREMQGLVKDRSGVIIPWYGHQYVAPTECPGVTNMLYLNTGLFNYSGKVVQVDITNAIVIFQPNDCLAQFIGHADRNGNVLELWWIKTAYDQQVRDNYIAAGSPIDTGPVTQGRFRNCILRGEVPTGDTYDWQPGDFWKVTSV